MTNSFVSDGIAHARGQRKPGHQGHLIAGQYCPAGSGQRQQVPEGHRAAGRWRTQVSTTRVQIPTLGSHQDATQRSSFVFTLSL